MGVSKTRVLLASVVLGLALLATCLYLCPHESCATVSAGQAGQTARCVAEPIRDLGHTTVQKQWEIVFPIRNTGARRLVLNELDPGCKCENRVRRTILISPGATANVTVTLDTRFASGPVEAAASFKTSDPAHPLLNLTVRAWVDAADVPGQSKPEDDMQVSILSRQ